MRDPTRDPAFLELAADLLIARNRRGESWAAAVAELFGDDCAARRHLRWMCEWALACRFEEVTGEQSPAAFALRMLGLELHYRQDLPTSYDDVSAPLDPDAQRRFALGVSMLARRRVLAISDDSAVRFAHAGWLALAGALALGLDEHRWSDLLRPGLAQATLDALTAALLIDSARRARSASFLDLLERLQARDPAEISLDMALAVVAALQADEPELVIDREELDVLRRSWLASSDAVRLRFLGTVDFGRNPLLIDFLWSQAGSANSYRVRRAVCETLARLGDATWETLGEQWRDMVERAVALDLSSRVRKRRSDWEQHGRPIASLCWILPLLALRAGEPARAQTAAVLAALHRLTARRDRQPNDSVPDVGLEISLAEGFKIAATKLADSGERAAD